MNNLLKHIDWDAFHFMRPEFLWLFAGVAVIFVVGLFGIYDEVKWRKSIAPHLRSYVITKGSETVKRWMLFVMVLIMAVGIVSVSGPTWAHLEEPGQKLESPLVIVVDLSQSMMATDIQPTRLERAKFKVNDLLDANPKTRVALIGFAGTAHLIVPLTDDYKIIRSHINSLKPSVMPFPGSNIHAALDLADSVASVSDAPATFLLVTDDLTQDLFTDLQRRTSNTVNTYEILPMNTPGGAKIPAVWGKSFMKNKKGEVVISALDGQMVNQLSAIENINVNPLTLDNSDVELMAKRIRTNVEFIDKAEENEEDWKDEGFLLIIPVAFFMLMWFRKGWVIFTFLLTVSLSSCTDDFTADDLWYTKDYQAQKAYDNGDFAEAAELFTQPVQKGNAYFKNGDYDNAILAYSQDSTAMGAYNLGLAYYKNGNIEMAEMAFEEAYGLDPSMDKAKQNFSELQGLTDGQDIDLNEAQEYTEQGEAENRQNKSPEDLSGGGQEAKKEDTQEERAEETVETEMRKGKELDEVPDDFESGNSDPTKILMRKVDDDPALFLKRKFKHQVKKKGIKPPKNLDKW